MHNINACHHVASELSYFRNTKLCRYASKKRDIFYSYGCDKSPPDVTLMSWNKPPKFSNILIIEKSDEDDVWKEKKKWIFPLEFEKSIFGLFSWGILYRLNFLSVLVRMYCESMVWFLHIASMSKFYVHKILSVRIR